MTPNLLEGLADVIDRLEKNEIGYMIVGSIASMIYDEPRLTDDMDLVIDVLARDAKKMTTVFPDDRYDCPPEEVIAAEINQRGQFNLVHQDSGRKIDLMVRKQTDHA